MVLQPVHEFTPRGRVRGGFASSHAGRPAFLRWLPDSLFHYYLSTAQRSPFLRSWNLAAFTDRIFALSAQLAMTAVRYSDAPAILLAAAGRRCPSFDACTNQSIKLCSGSFNN
jgi:hypothetical protein